MKASSSIQTATNNGVRSPGDELVNKSNSEAVASGMVNADRFLRAVSEIKCYGKKGTSVKWVNWRKDQFQIMVYWNRNSGLTCYLNFFSVSDRDSVHARLFERYAEPGEKPFLQEGHGWSKLRHDFRSNKQLSINELAKVADELQIKYTVIYAQESVEYRHLFSIMGIPLVPGEMGKELINGQIVPYSREIGKNL